MTTRDALIAAVPEEAAARTQDMPLQHGRRLSLAASGGDDLLEIRAAGGALELRIRMTAEGPVLQMESLRLSLKATRDVEVACAKFSVRATESVTLAAEGTLQLAGATDLQLQAAGDVRVAGRMIHLN